MLGAVPIVGFVATRNAERLFYSEILGLAVISEDPFALVCAVGAGHLRIQKVGALTPPALHRPGLAGGRYRRRRRGAGGLRGRV